MTDNTLACQKQTPALNTHASNVHKTAGYRAVEGASVHEAFHHDSGSAVLNQTHHHATHKAVKPQDKPMSTLKPAPEPLSAQDHHEAVEAAHTTSHVAPHVGHAIKAAETKTGVDHGEPHVVHGKVAPKDLEVTHPLQLQEKIKSASIAVTQLPDTHKEHKDAIQENLQDTAVGVEKVSAAKTEHAKASAKVENSKKKVDKAEKDATDAQGKLHATIDAHKAGKVPLTTVASAQKDAAAKTKVAQKAAMEHIEAKKGKEHAATELEAAKHKTATSASAAVKGAHVAASTSKGASKPIADKVAEHTHKTLKPMLPKPSTSVHQKVKTGCDFLNDAVLLTDLKPMHSLHGKGATCIGFGSYIEKGEQKLGAVHCKVDPHTNACPTQFEPSLCHIVPMDMNKLEPYFKDIFN